MYYSSATFVVYQVVFDEIMIISAEYYTNKLSWIFIVLGLLVDMSLHSHVLPILSQPVLSFILLLSDASLRWYHTLQGDNSLKSVEHFDHMMFVCRFQASR